MDATLSAWAGKAPPVFWFGLAMMAGSLAGTVMGLWLPRVTTLFVG